MLAFSATGIACQWLVTLSSEPRGHSGVTDAADAARAACGREPVGPPPFTPQGDSPNRYFVIREASPTIEGGTFDLDCLDTRCDDPAPALACKGHPDGSFCDDPGGGDNQIISAGSRRGVRLEQDRYGEGVRRGELGIVIALLGYSGEADDSAVGVAIFPSGGARERRPCGDADAASDAAASDAMPDATPGNIIPAFDGCDVFYGDPEFVQLGTPLETTTGYVSQGTLVVRLNDRATFPAWAGYGVRYIPLAATVLEAKLVVPDAGGPLQMRGVLAGRITPSAILRGLGEQRAEGQPPLCLLDAGGLTWDYIRSSVCSELDLPAAGASPDEPCAEMSFQFAFDAVSVVMSDQTAPRYSAATRCVEEAGVAKTAFACP